MAIYGIGAMYDCTYDKKMDFIKNNCVCIGYGLQDAPALHKMLSKVKIGDFIYIKSLTGQSSKALIIKAVGIVTDDRVE